MVESSLVLYAISDIVEWREMKQLDMMPEYFRQRKFTRALKSFVISNLLKGLPVPVVVIRNTLKPKSGKMTREVIDGHQILTSIFEFLDDKITISLPNERTTEKYAFSELSSFEKGKFLSYILPVYLISNVNDSEILDVFMSLNATSVPLTKTEILMATYKGAFQKLVYELGQEYQYFFVNNRIMSRNALARLGSAEIVSEILITILEGDFLSKRNFEKYFREYDNHFNDTQNIRNLFRIIMELIESTFKNQLSKSKFHRRSLFVSMFCALVDVLFEFPLIPHRVKPIRYLDTINLRRELDEIDRCLDPKNRESRCKEIYESFTYNPSSKRSKLVRHEIIRLAIRHII